MSIATQMVLLTGCFLGFGALAVDVGWLENCHAQAQGAADAASLAAAANLASGNSAAIASAKTIGALNSVAGKAVLLQTADVHIGTLTNGKWTDSATGRYVKVDAKISGVPAFFGGALGFKSYTVAASSVSTATPGTVCGIFATSLFELNGTANVDAYDSTVGKYPAAINAKGGICTNNKLMTLQGNIKINADARPGPSGTVVVKGSATLTGSTTPLASEIYPISATLPTSYSTLPAKFTKDTTLAPGDYYAPSGFQIDAKVQVTISGKTRIFSKGDVTINGKGFVNTSQNPANLTIYVIGNHSTHNNGSSTFYGSIYAPESEIELNGNADFYGSVIGDYIHINGNMGFHIDTSLTNLAPNPSGGVRMVM